MFLTTKRLVRKYYSEIGVKEWRRLVRDHYHRLEFETTMHFFKKHSPFEGLVLDAVEDLADMQLNWQNWDMMLSYLI